MSKTFFLRVRSTVIEEYSITATDIADARRRFERGDPGIDGRWELVKEIERPDIEITGITEDK